jgi:hypothetical protein
MDMAKIIKMRIKDGAATIETSGFVGAECLKATAALEAALGKKTSDRPTREMTATTATKVKL